MPFVEGFINEDGFACCSVRVEGLRRPVIVAIDTGFEGDIQLLRDFLPESLGELLTRSAPWVMGSGTPEILDETDRNVEWFGRRRLV